jgi:uncharacterized protein involved in type VI secretion and phage assembly
MNQMPESFQCPTYFGKYRGEVTNNIDPMGLGRVQVSVPDVLGEGGLAWAMPCAAFGGPSVGLFSVPPMRAKVWVEFERGDPNYPILAGCYWGTGEAPPALPQQPVTQSISGNGYSIEAVDTPGAPMVTIRATFPTGEAKLEMTAAGVTLAFGEAKIQLTQTSVSINGTNLVVMI